MLCGKLQNMAQIPSIREGCPFATWCYRSSHQEVVSVILPPCILAGLVTNYDQ